MARKLTYRVVDGDHVDGVYRSVFRKNGDRYYLTDLSVYADGTIDCWGHMDLDGFREQLDAGKVTTSPPDGGRAQAHHLAGWTFGEVSSHVSADDLYLEVVDEIESLAGRTTSTQKCLSAVEVFLDTPTEENRAQVLEAYLAIPAHLRVYALGDQDAKDNPLRILATPEGEVAPSRNRNIQTVATPERHQSALAYFERRRAKKVEHEEKFSAVDPGTVSIEMRFFREGWPTAGRHLLRLEYPFEIEFGAETYSTAAHALWSQFVVTEEDRLRVREEDNAFGLPSLALEMGMRPDWLDRRLAITRQVLIAKFSQHPAAAEELLASNNKRIEYTDGYQLRSYDKRNSIGQLLELVRSELAVSGDK